MGHDTHFLRRLERLPTRQLDFALELYRNPDLVRFILQQSSLPDGATRVAIAIEDRPDGPHIIVARDGGFVTCLGDGMSVGDSPVISRPRLDKLSQQLGTLEQAFALADDRSEATRLFNNLIHNGPALSREDFSSLMLIAAIIESELIPLIGDMYVSIRDVQKRFRESRYRRPNKAAIGELQKYWKTMHAMGHIVALCGTRGKEMGRAMFPENDYERERIPFMIGGMATNSAIPSIMFKGAWTAARGGRKLVTHFKPYLQTTESFLDIATSALPMVVTALRHRGARGEVRKLLARARRRFEPTAKECFDSFLSARLLRDWGYLFEPGVEDASRQLQHEIGAQIVLKMCANLPEDHLDRFNTADEVPDELACAVMFYIDGNIFLEEHTRLAMSLTVPWLARADGPEMYLPARWLDTFAPTWDHKSTIAQLQHLHAYLYDIPVRSQPKPGRNHPCPCGSGKKYKRCCIDR